ncbi:MAG: OmpH family outer membrane protein [Alphaproteobacteria bacterium]
MAHPARTFNSKYWPLVLAAMCLTLLVQTSTAFAQQNPTEAPKFGFVNLVRVAQEANAAVTAGKRIEAYGKNVEQRFRTREEALREEDQALGRRRSILAPDAFREEDRKFREKVDLAQREFQEIRRQVQQATFEAQQIIDERMTTIISEVAAERKINFVFNQTQVTFVNPLAQFDLTDEVVRRMNATLPEVPVNLPKE